MEDRVSKEQKLFAAKDIVASYLKGEGGKHVSPEQIGHVFSQVFNAIDQTIPDPEKRRVGLG
ncbi:hypothetical protein [Vampirovibrio chlorellavorus]|uniref:hypothetical protein n=1 Tax=Vampirovibrio chlorellavorus TaxID=758823 RepID=UPI0026E9C1CC|nr:hypothetical protein [Vampirovibrio chlorellavorus]